MRNRVSLNILIFCFAIAGWLVPIHATDALLNEEVPILETTNFEVLRTDFGHLDVTIKANAMRHYQNGNVELIGEISIMALGHIVDQKEGAGAIYIQADLLSYNKKSHLCMIEGNVKVHQPDEQLHMQTERLSYDTEEATFFTDNPISIKHKKNSLSGGGLRASKDLKKYVIMAPTGTIQVQEASIAKN